MKMGAFQIADHMWKAVSSHSLKGHQLRLLVDDYGQSIRCVFCGCELIEGSPELMTLITERLTERGVSFEVLCQTVVQG